MPDGLSLPARRYFFQSPPRTNQNTGIIGSVVALTTSATPLVVNLALLLVPAAYSPQSAQSDQQFGVLGRDGNFLTIFADTTDIGILFGETQALVSGANAPVLGTVSTVSGSGVVTHVAGVCHRIPTGQSQRYHLQQGKDLWMAVVATGAGVVRFYQSNPPGI